jgi:hypothetical protein
LNDVKTEKESSRRHRKGAKNENNKDAKERNKYSCKQGTSKN